MYGFIRCPRCKPGELCGLLFARARQHSLCKVSCSARRSPVLLRLFSGKRGHSWAYFVTSLRPNLLRRLKQTTGIGVVSGVRTPPIRPGVMNPGFPWAGEYHKGTPFTRTRSNESKYMSSPQGHGKLGEPSERPWTTYEFLLDRRLQGDRHHCATPQGINCVPQRGKQIRVVQNQTLKHFDSV